VGWDWGIPFGSFAGLIQNITTGTPPDFVCGAGMFGSCPPPGDNEVTELGIDAHGDSGVVDIDCHSQINQGVIPASAYYDVLNVATIHGKYAPQMKELDRLLVKDHGVLFFAGCRTGAGVSGSEFLMEVSKMLPGRDIIAMTTITITIPGRVKWSMSGGGVCCQPGTRDTSYQGRTGSISQNIRGPATHRRTPRSRVTGPSSEVVAGTTDGGVCPRILRRPAATRRRRSSLPRTAKPRLGTQ